MLRKAAALAVMLCLALGPVSAGVYAVEDGSEMLSVLAVMGVMNGDERGNLNLSALVTRAEFVKMAVAASVNKDKAVYQSNISPYSDVPASAWYAGYVAAARDCGYVSGYLDGSFRPEQNVTLEEAVSIMLKVMGYSDEDFTMGYPASHLSLYSSLDMDKGLTCSQGQAMTRENCARLIYNALTAKAKSGQIYAQELGYSVDMTGNLDYALLTASAAKGPVLCTGTSLFEDIGFEPLTVYRDRQPASKSSISAGDVLYYIEEVKTVWAYSQKISGVVQAISPSTASPSAVTVSGQTCTLGSSSAKYSFSDLGTVKVGDSVTLLLGAGGQCVFVLEGQNASQTVEGIVLSVGTVPNENQFGQQSQSRYISIMSSDGRVYSYPYLSGSLEAGDAVSASVSADGVKISRAGSGHSLGGSVAGGVIEGRSLKNAGIIDYCAGRGVAVTAQRLEGVRISSSDVIYCSLDSEGEIKSLFLDNLTGDCLEYGVLASSVKSPDIMTSASSYTYIVNGVGHTLSKQGTFPVKEGPCSVEYDADGGVKTIKSLTGEKVLSVNGISAVLSGTGDIKTSGSLQVYVKNGDDYYLSSISEVTGGGYTLKGYYDKKSSEGGCLRVLVAEKQ